AIVTAYDYYPFGMLMPGRGTDSINAVSNVMGNTLLVYNDFSDGTTQGWMNYGNGTISNAGQRLKVRTTDNFAGTYKVTGMVPGRSYRLRMTVDRGTYTGQLRTVLLNNYSWSYFYYTELPQQVNQVDYSFTATSPSLAIVTEPFNTGPMNRDFYIDNFIFEEIRPQPQVDPVTSNGCITMTRSKWVTTWVDSCNYVYNWQWPGFLVEVYNGQPQATTVKKTGTAVEFNVANGEAAVFTLSVLPNVAQSIDLDLESVQGNAQLAVQEEQGGSWVGLASTVATAKGNFTLNFTPTQAQVKVKIIGPCFVGVKKFCTKKPVMKQENVLVDICPADKDKYRFGFNGQE
ncbi:hypothetical protein, partial [Taibaiella helva]|uniref:hypothetical protein n=1 Tax=Taibaiella helva TaxID=2301235 RepID=UPI001300A432